LAVEPWSLHLRFGADEALGLAPEFVTDPSTQTTSFDDCLILLYDGRIADHGEIVPLLEKVAASSKPVLIVAHECDDDALATLVLNHQRHVVHCVVVKSPGFGEREIEILRDIAAYTGATVVDKTIGLALRFTTMDDLGTARRVVVTTAVRPSVVAPELKNE
jgi:chaperonin GroEL